MTTLTLIEQPTKVSLTGNPMVFQFRAANYASLSLFKVTAEVLLWDGSTYTALPKDAISVDEDGLGELNVQELLRYRITRKFTYPESKYNLMLEHTDLTGKFKIQYSYQGWDADNNFLEGEPIAPTDVFYYIEGGLPDIIRQLQNEVDSDWYQELSSNKSFMTNQPLSKVIHPEQCEKLYWLVREGCTILKLNLQVDLLDGTKTSSQPSAISVTPLNFVEITATLKHLVDDVSLVASYKIWLTDQHNAVISEVFEYILDHTYYERNDFLSFSNSLGTFDTLWLHGQASAEIEGDRESYSKQLPDIRPRLEDKSTVSTRGLMARNNKSNTGWITAEYNEYLSAEFLGSDEVMCLIGDQLWPVINITDSTEPFDDDDELTERNLNIEWQLGDKTRYYGKFSKEIKHPLPPQWNDIEACYMRMRNGKLIDIKGGKDVLIVSNGIAFTKLNNDVFHRSNVDYWQEDLGWNGGTYSWPLAEITGTFTVLHSTELCRSLLFFKDIEGDDIKSTFPIIVYKSARTEAQQEDIVAYMDEYFFVTDKGDLLTDNEQFVIDKI